MGEPRNAPAEPYLLPRLEGCARCHGEGHDSLTFQPFTHPVEVGGKSLTHWATCPTTGEPILLAMVAAAEGPSA